jgi:hypothetical protein
MFARNRFFPATKLFFMITLLAGLVTANPIQAGVSVPDPVLEWIGVMNDTVLAGATNPLATTRVAALVSAAVFDSVNGIHPNYRSL